jgi:protein-S-isoprenylcysteine O-methyltransferase Ste14
MNATLFAEGTMNHDHEMSAYGLWSLVIINSAVFIIFAFSFTQPKTKRDWRTFGSFAAFIIALFTEMYGFPLTIYLLSGWLGSRVPGLDPLSHNAGHIWPVLFGWTSDPHGTVLHILSNVFIFGGFILLASAWQKLLRAQQNRELAVTGPYAYVRHPQYVAFVAIMFGFLLQWPTLITLAMFPILTIVYVRLARREEREAVKEFGRTYDDYAATTPEFFPRLWHKRDERAHPTT